MLIWHNLVMDQYLSNDNTRWDFKDILKVF